MTPGIQTYKLTDVKRISVYFVICAFSIIPVQANCASTSDTPEYIADFGGTWELNNTDDFSGGELKIYNCTNGGCNFEIQSWRDQHTCDTSGQIELISPTTGVYSSERYMYDKTSDLEYAVPVGINFELLSDGDLRLKYTNSDSHGAFCGMSATLEGIWTKQKD